MQEVPRILGLDIGDRRVGVAMSDALGMAQPLITMGRSTPKQEMKNLQRLVRKHGVTAVVAGLPLNMDGTRSAQTEKAEEFALAVREALGLPLYFQDERLSSREADDWLDRRGYPRGPGRKAILDRVAAMVLLQDWLDAQPRRG